LQKVVKDVTGLLSSSAVPLGSVDQSARAGSERVVASRKLRPEVIGRNLHFLPVILTCVVTKIIGGRRFDTA
jgi:hypothetical protein